MVFMETRAFSGTKRNLEVVRRYDREVAKQPCDGSTFYYVRPGEDEAFVVVLYNIRLWKTLWQRRTL